MTADVATDWPTIVGVAPDVAGSRQQTPEPVIYLPQSQAPSPSLWVLLRTQAGDTSVMQPLREAIRGVDPALPAVDGPLALTNRLRQAYRYRTVVATLFGGFAAIALLLACVGLYAVVAHVVHARTREIGVRTALAASTRQILVLVLSDSVRAVALGAAAGLALWLLLGWLIGRVVQEWSPSLVDVSAAAAVLALAAGLGCLVPVSRALSIDPGRALRPE